jgi:hypothetical protein
LPQIVTQDTKFPGFRKIYTAPRDADSHLRV